VRAAEALVETEALAARYQTTLSQAPDETCRRALLAFEQLVANSTLVVSRSLMDVKRLADSEENRYTNHLNLVRAGVKLPGGDKWERLRRAAGTALFPGYEDDIGFGALSLNGKGLPNYGPCAVVLKDEYIAHRSSVFECNSVTFMTTHRLEVTDPIPPGYRATWSNRGRLAAAKLGGRITAGMDSDDAARLLLSPAANPEDDDLVEVHIWGGFTVRAIASVSILPPTDREGRMITRTLESQLVRQGVPVEVRWRSS